MHGFETLKKPMLAGGEMASVSVIIPAYNAAGTLRRAVASCLNQSGPVTEIIIIDDGSTDETLTIARSFADPVRVISQANAGPGAARNAGAWIAKGEWLAFLDADDWWMPDKLERQWVVAREPGVDIVHSRTNKSVANIPPLLTFADLWQFNWISNSSAMVKHAVFKALGGFDEHPDIFVCEDYNLWLRAAASGYRIALCDELLTYYTPGFGVSADMVRFLKGSERNLDQISKQAGIPASEVERKRVENLIHIGRAAFYQRNLPFARKLLARAFRQSPSFDTGLWAVASWLPREILEVQRRHIKAGPALFGSSRGQALPSALPVPAGFDTPDDRPAILVVVHGEEADSESMHEPRSIRRGWMSDQQAAQRIYRKHGIVPTYAVDPGVVGDPTSSAILREYLASGEAEIAAQFQLPDGFRHEDILSESQLPPYTEFEHVARLTRAIEDRFGVQPRLYRGGPLGAGEYTGRILTHFGYRIDCTNLSALWHRQHPGVGSAVRSGEPFWEGPDGQLLRVPEAAGPNWPAKYRLGGFLGRGVYGALHPRRLSPEDHSLAQLRKHATDLVRHQGRRILVFTYHAACLRVGGTAHVRSNVELERFLARIDAFMDFFMSDLNGIAATPAQIYGWAKPPR